jgi:hypothetical protein
MSFEEDFLKYRSYQNAQKEQEYFIEHAGKKGMKWGQRKAIDAAKQRSKNPYRYGNSQNAQLQRQVDVMKYVAAGKGKSFAFSQKTAKKRLYKMRQSQAAIKNGEKRIKDKYLRANGIDLRDIRL